jgi:putative transposase
MTNYIPEQPKFIGHETTDIWFLPMYRRNLPHLRLAAATYFVTFRLADSIPKNIVVKWQQEHDLWLKQYGINPAWKRGDQFRMNAYHAIPLDERKAFEKIQRRRFFIELDKSHGSCLLTNFHTIVAEALEYFHGQRVWCGDYVVMPNHVHVLVQPFADVKLEQWLYSVKRYTSTKIMKKGPSNIQESIRKRHLWQKESFDRIVRDVEELTRTRRYIEANPAKLPVGSYTLKKMSWLDPFTL